MPKPPRQCIFCGEGNLSDEHVFPRWMKSVPSDVEHSFHALGRLNINKKQYQLSKGKLNRPGKSVNQKLRVICLKCNNEWGSALQKKIKEIIGPIVFEGVFPDDLHESKSVIARWCALSGMVFETVDQKTITSTPDERRTVRTDGIAPRNWGVWLASLKRAVSEPSHARRAFFIGDEKADVTPNSHVDFVMAGQLAYITASAPMEFKDHFFSTLVPYTCGLLPLHYCSEIKVPRVFSGEEEFIQMVASFFASTMMPS